MDENNELELEELEVEDTKQEKKDWWVSVIDWAANHKLICCLSVIGIPIILIWFGAKLFSTTETVEVEKLPDPTILDKYDRIPVAEHSMTEYAYVLKDEYKQQ